jgi:hypothetical protein
MEHPAELRFITYLSPGIPRAFFEAIVKHVRRTLGRRASLSVETRVSGPMRGGDDPFSKGEADIGFVCVPSFFWLREMENPPVELLPTAPVFGDVRSLGQPVYFSEVVVCRESPARSFLDLRGSSWAYNDPCSLSGYYSLLKKLAEKGEDECFFGRVVCSGSHLNSMEMIARGEADAAAIDSNVLKIKPLRIPESVSLNTLRPRSLPTPHMQSGPSPGVSCPGGRWRPDSRLRPSADARSCIPAQTPPDITARNPRKRRTLERRGMYYLKSNLSSP